MNKKQKKTLQRIIIAAILTVALALLFHFVALPWFVQLILWLVPYLVIGHDVLRKAFMGIKNGEVFDENFLMAIATIVTGSGNSAFFAFSPLLPEAAASVGYNTMALVVPVQLAASLARPMSPISGVIIAVSGIAGLTPIELIRRTIPVMVLGMVVNVIAAQIFL